MIDRYNSKNSIVGTLYLTATHLIFVDPEANKETWVSVLRASNLVDLIPTQFDFGFRGVSYSRQGLDMYKISRLKKVKYFNHFAT